MDLLTRLIRRPIALFAVLAVVLPISLWGAWNAFASASNRVDEWLPEDFEATEDLRRFVERFGSDELLMITWEGCAVDDPRARDFATKLLAPPTAGGAQVPLFRRVISAEEVLNALESAPLELSRDEALERTSGWLTSADGEVSGLLALVSEAGAADRRAARDHARAVARETAGLQGVAIRMAGPSIEGVAIDDASQSGLITLNLASFGVCFLVLAGTLRSLRVALLILGLALFCEQLCLAIVWYTGGHMDSILLLAANLTFVLSVSISVHLVNYYRESLRVSTAEEAPILAFRTALTPTAFSVMTTVMGLGSLMVSSILPIQKFGFYAAVSLIVATLAVIVLIPGHFFLWPLRETPRTAGGIGASLARWAPRLENIGMWVVAGATFILLAGLAQLPQLRTSVGVTQLLASDNPLIEDYRWIEREIGPLIPVEIVLEMPSGDPRATVEQFRAVTAVHRSLQQIPQTSVISSVLFSAEPPPRRGGFRQLVRATAFRRSLVENQDRLAELGYVRFDEGRNDWRVTLRTSALDDKDYGVLLQDIYARVEDAVAREGLTDHCRLFVSGGVPLVYQAQQHVLEDILSSFGLAFVLIAATLMLVFRSFLAGIVCMLPNVLPTAIVFGWLAWRGVPVEVGTVLTASAALGISVDNSLHFIARFQECVRDGLSAAEATAAAYRTCGEAMVETSLVCGLGLVVFGASDFLPISRFSGCITTLLALALVADLLVLPAILVSPLNRLFLRQARSAAGADRSLITHQPENERAPGSA